MRNKVFNILIFISINLFYATVLSLLAVFFFSKGMEGGYTFIFFALIVTSLFPIFNYFQGKIESALFPLSHDDVYAQIIDSILNIENFDELLKETFDQVLRLMYSRVGQLIFYNQASDEFELYYQKGKKQDNAINIDIDKNNILLQGIKGPNDILIKGWLDPVDEGDKELIIELDKLGADIVVPIYYKDTFLGLILIGEKRRFVEKEIRLIRIFASKIAIHVQNSFYFKRVLKRKELEKEYELTSKIQKQFLPKPNLKKGRISVDAYYKTAASVTREYYDIFTVDNVKEEVRISVYHIYGDIKEISILLPGVKALLQCFARLGYSPFDSINILGKIGVEKDLLIGDFAILHSSIWQDGCISYYNNGYSLPLIFKKATKVFRFLFEAQSAQGAYNMQIENGDLLFITCESFHNLIIRNIVEYQEIISKNFSLPIGDLKKVIVDSLIEKEKQETDRREKRQDEDDKLLVLIKLEEGS